MRAGTGIERREFASFEDPTADGRRRIGRPPEWAGSAVTGGGTWETFEDGNVPLGRGSYQVTGLASWEFASLQTLGLIDLIGDTNERANGNAVLRIEILGRKPRHSRPWLPWAGRAERDR